MRELEDEILHHDGRLPVHREPPQLRAGADNTHSSSLSRNSPRGAANDGELFGRLVLGQSGERHFPDALELKVGNEDIGPRAGPS